MNVLLIDDETIVLKGLLKMIDWKQLGLVVSHTAVSAEQAIDIVRSEEIDIIVTDISMEGMNGLEMLKILNKDKLLEDKVVIILSGYREFAYAQEAIKNNVFEYVTKPVARKDFAAVLVLAEKRLLEKRKSKRENSNEEIEFRNITKAHDFLNEKFFEGRTFDKVSDSGLDKDIKRLIETIEFSVRQSIIPLADVVLDKLAVKSGFEEMVFKKSVFALYFEIFNLYNEDFLMIQKLEKDTGTYFSSFKEMKSWFIKQLELINDNISTELLKKNDVVFQVKEYIDNNYSKELSLSKVAAMAYMSPNYFCAVFKRKVGKNFHDYVLDIRMQKARKLLLTKQYKIYEVANLVGYTNARYFSVAFKKYFNISPQKIEVE